MRPQLSDAVERTTTEPRDGRAGVRSERDAALDGSGAEDLEDGGLERRRVVGGGIVLRELAVLAEVAEDALTDRAGELVDVVVGDLHSDLDLALVDPYRRRFCALRRWLARTVGGAAGVWLGPEQWVGVVDAGGVRVCVDLHLATVDPLRGRAGWVLVAGSSVGLPRPTRWARAVPSGAPDDPARAAALARAAWTRVVRGDLHEAGHLIERARTLLLPALRRAAGATPGGLRGVDAALPAALRRRLAATWPECPTRVALRTALRALAALAVEHDLAPADFAVLAARRPPRR